MKHWQPSHILNSPFFTNSECNALFAVRSHTLRGVEGNTPSIRKDNMSCPLNCDINSEDVQVESYSE